MQQPTEWLYRIHPTRLGMLTEGPTQAEGEAMAAHFQYLQRLHNDGTLILAGPTLVLDDSNFGVVIFNVPDADAARKIMESDPAVQAGVMQAALFPFRVSLLKGRDS